MGRTCKEGPERTALRTAFPVLLPRPHGAHELLYAGNARQNLGDEVLAPVSLSLPRLWLQASSAHSPRWAEATSLGEPWPREETETTRAGGPGLIRGALLPRQEWPAAPFSCTRSAPTAGSLPCCTSPGWRLTGTRPRKVGAQPPCPTPSPLGPSLPHELKFLSVGAAPFYLAPAM